MLHCSVRVEAAAVCSWGVRHKRYYCSRDEQSSDAVYLPDVHVDLIGHEAITSRISSDVADIRLFSFIDAKGSISTSLFVSILKLVSILSGKNLLNRLANSKLVS